MAMMAGKTPDHGGISYREAAEILDVSDAIVSRLIKEGTLARIDARKPKLTKRQVQEYAATTNTYRRFTVSSNSSTPPSR